MRILDLYCGAGMASDGYAAAGFEVVGVDINPQPHYPYQFFVRDALDWLRENGASKAPFHPENGVIHASPPCQEHTRAKHLRDAQGGTSKYDNLLTPTLALLRERWSHIPWVVENVPGAPFDPQPGEWLTTMCGSSFGLGVRRHRLFLTNFPVTGLPCRHKEQGRPWGVYHVPGDSIPQGGRTARDAEHGCEVMGVSRPLPWNSLKEGFPPAYTEHIGRQLTAHLQERAA
jgi:DNA (cytosine-5)-methyltransferase 1